MTDQVRLLAEALHAAGIGCEGRYACASTHHVHTAAARALLSHCPPGLIIATTDELARALTSLAGNYSAHDDPGAPVTHHLFAVVLTDIIRESSCSERQHEPIGSCAEGEG